MTTIYLTVLKQRQKSNGHFTVYIAVTHKREVRYITTEYEIDDLFQFEEGKIVCRKDAKIMNQRLQYVLSEYQEKLDAIERPEIYNCSQLKEILEGKAEEQRKAEQLITIKDYMELRMERLHQEKRDGHVKINRYCLSKILEIIGNVTLESVSPATIMKFADKLNIGNSTQGIVLRNFRAVINAAIKEGFVKYETHPFTYAKIPKPSIRQLDLTIEEFNAIKNLNIKEKKLMVARDVFLLSFYLGGINLVDLLQVNLSGNTIIYVRHKTRNKKQGNKEVTFTIPEEAKPIIKKYIQRNGTLDFGYKFTYENFRSYLDRCIKKMGEQLNIESKMCYYCARKTFSQFTFDLGIRTEIIEYCIGQSMWKIHSKLLPLRQFKQTL
jgi:integrase